jgi:hypothetical protein
MLEREGLPGRGKHHPVNEQREVVGELFGIPLTRDENEQSRLELTGKTCDGEGAPTRRHRPDAVEIR